MIISCSILPRMRNVSEKSCRKKQHIFCVQYFFFFENRAVYETMWENIVEWGRSQMTIWRMRIACWISTATNRHLQDILLVAFPLKQWLHERAPMLCYTYIACIVFYSMYAATQYITISNVCRLSNITIYSELISWSSPVHATCLVSITFILRLMHSQPAVPYTHTHHRFKITLPNTDQVHDKYL